MEKQNQVIAWALARAWDLAYAQAQDEGRRVFWLSTKRCSF